jgi:hypothetical protein
MRSSRSNAPFSRARVRPAATRRRARCDDFTYDDNFLFARDHLGELVDTHVLREDYVQYRYLLNLPGKTLGSYSRNLNHLWSLHSVVLLWKAAYSEWFYPALVEGETHLDVDYATLVPTVERLNADAALVDRLREGALRVHDTLVCPRCLATHMSNVVDKLRARFSLGIVLDDPCETYLVFRNWTACDKVDLVGTGARNPAKTMKRPRARGARRAPPGGRRTVPSSRLVCGRRRRRVRRRSRSTSIAA